MLADLRILVGGAGAHLGDLAAALDRDAHPLELADDGLDGLRRSRA
jgi:hypothetical protein